MIYQFKSLFSRGKSFLCLNPADSDMLRLHFDEVTNTEKRYKVQTNTEPIPLELHDIDADQCLALPHAQDLIT